MLRKGNIEKIAYAILFGCVIITVFLTMDYSDGLINSWIGYNISLSILKGEFATLFNNSSWLYGLVIYFIYAVWSLPIAIIDLIRGVDRVQWGSPTIILWYKILLLAFILLCCYWIYKIALEMVADKKASMEFMWLVIASPLMIFPTLAITQCDVMSLSFMLAGLYYLMKRNDKAFVIYFAIAITMKYMALFIFVPLFFYRYKEAKQMLRVGITAASLLILSVIVMSFSHEFRYSISNPRFYDIMTQVDTFFSGSTISLGMGEISVVAAYFLMICIIAHFIKPVSEREHKGWILWITLAGWLTLFLFFGAQSYWYILIAPFVFGIILNRIEHLQFGLFAGIVLSNVMFLERVCSQRWVFGGGETFNHLLLRNYVTNHSPILAVLLNRLTNNFFAKLNPVYGSIIFVLAFALLWVYRPPKEDKLTDISSKTIKIAKWIQLMLLALWVGLTIWGVVRLTEGERYDYSKCSVSENVVVTENTAELSLGDSIIFKSGSMYSGNYELFIEAKGLSEDNVYISYYYNEEIPIDFSIISYDGEKMVIRFMLDDFKDYVNFGVTNSTPGNVEFTSFTIREVR